MTDGLAPPSLWKRIRLRFLLDEIDQRVGSSDTNLPLLSVSIHRGVLPRSEMTDRVARADGFVNYKLVAPGDVVINRMRAFQGGAGISAYRGIVSSDYAVLRSKDALDSRFLHHLIRSRWFVSEMTARLRGIGNADLGNVRTPRINVDDLGDIVVALPPVGEQRAISNYLDAETHRAESVISLKARLLAALDERWKARVVAAMWNPEGHRTRLKYLLDASIPGAWGSDAGHDDVDVTVLRSVDIDWQRLTTQADGGSVRSVSLHDATRRQFKYGDLMLEKSGGAAEAGVGRAVEVLVPPDTPAIPTNFAQLLRPSKSLPFGLVKYTFAAAYYRKLNLRSIKQTTIANLDLDAFLSEEWRFPKDPAEMGPDVMALDDALARRIETSDRISHQLDLLAEHRQALSTAAVTGQLRIPLIAA